MAFLDKLGSLAKNFGDKNQRSDCDEQAERKNYIGKGSCGNRAEKNR